ncbi:MAG: hypothetical protein K6G29_14090 [Clostridiales bacterium]|nr:hypothetical protein [Clostridiales bacterium]
MLSALKNFGVTFLISALIFGIIAYFATLFVSRTVNDILEDDHGSLDEITAAETETVPAETTPPDDTTPEEPLPDGETFNLLLVTTDYRPDLYNDYAPDAEAIQKAASGLESAVPTLGILSVDFREVNATSIVLLRVDRERRQFVYTYFTPEMTVYTPSGYRTLSEITTVYGMGSLAEYINAMTGLKIHYSMLIDGYHFDELASILGSVTVNLPRDIYSDGREITFEYDTKVQRVGEDGWPWTESVPNQWLMGIGDNTIDGDALWTLSLAAEHTEADRDAKQSYTLSIVKAYLTAIASLDEAAAHRVMEQLLTAESGWSQYSWYVPPVIETPVEIAEPGEEGETPEEPEEAEAPAEAVTEPDPDLPFDITPVGGEATQTAEPSEEGEEPEETKAESKGPIWVLPLGEPDKAVLETGFTMTDFENTYELLKAVNTFATVNVTYPCTYIPAADNRAEVFDVKLRDGLELFAQWRAPAKE